MLAALWLTNLFEEGENEVTRRQFELLLKEKQAKNIVITQNKTVPTGKVEFTAPGEEGDRFLCLYVSDVNEIQGLESGVVYFYVHYSSGRLIKQSA